MHTCKHLFLKILKKNNKIIIMNYISIAIIFLVLANSLDSKPASICLNPINWCKSIENALECDVNYF